jgi:hypothetical protein
MQPVCRISDTDALSPPAGKQASSWDTPESHQYAQTLLAVMILSTRQSVLPSTLCPGSETPSLVSRHHKGINNVWLRFRLNCTSQSRDLVL